MRLLMSEWQRFWARKMTWLLFAAVPVMVFACSKYFLQTNEHTDPGLPQYSVCGNFSVLSFEEMLLTVFNLFVIIFGAFIVTDEYRSGQLRMVMLRAYTFGQFFWAKTIVILGMLLLLTVFYFVCSWVAGFLVFPHSEEIHLFYHHETTDIWGGLLYSLGFYGLGFLTLIAMTAVVMFISVISHTVTTAIGTGIGFYLLSLFYPFVTGYFIPLIGQSVAMKVSFSSLPMIEWQGLVFLLAEPPQYLGFILGVIGFYIVVFGGLAYFTFTRKDRWI